MALLCSFPMSLFYSVWCGLRDPIKSFQNTPPRRGFIFQWHCPGHESELWNSLPAVVISHNGQLDCYLHPFELLLNQLRMQAPSFPEEAELWIVSNVPHPATSTKHESSRLQVQANWLSFRAEAPNLESIPYPHNKKVILGQQRRHSPTWHSSLQHNWDIKLGLEECLGQNVKNIR